MNKCIGIIYSAVLLLSACSNSLVQEKNLATPQISSDGLSIEWNPIKYASNYSIYLDDSNDLLTTTENCFYAFDKTENSFSIYVVANPMNNNYFKCSNKSNVVLIALPVLKAPTLNVDENKAYWEPVKYADYYEIYSDADTFISRTAETFFTFENNSNFVNIYAVACYEKFIGKNSSKSNTVTLKPDIISLDINSYKDNRFVIKNYIKSIEIKGQNDDLSFVIESREEELTISLINCILIGSQGLPAIKNESDSVINIAVEGTCKLTGGPGSFSGDIAASSIKSNSINFYGINDKSAITLSGGKAETDFYFYRNGVIGVESNSICFKNIEAYIFGGNGGNGLDGSKGSQGKAEWRGGTDGGKGDTGSDGGKGGLPISNGCVITVQNSNINLKAGNGGKGGNGGNGGDGGVFYDTATIYLDKNVGGINGGDGGKGGNGGDSYASTFLANYYKNDNLTYLDGEAGTFGYGGEGGKAGSATIGWLSSYWEGTAGSRGKNGQPGSLVVQ